jgi:hypothetical protein
MQSTKLALGIVAGLELKIPSCETVKLHNSLNELDSSFELRSSRGLHEQL